MNRIKFQTLFSLLMVLGIVFSQCTNSAQKKPAEAESDSQALDWAVRMADSEMVHFPEAATVDFVPEGKWSYTAGLVSLAMVKLTEETGDEKYYDYAKGYADQFINEDGEIKGYKKSDFNIDQVNSGKFLFELFKLTEDERYSKAIYTLRDQLKDHPRTSEGGFWHKKR